MATQERERISSIEKSGEAVSADQLTNPIYRILLRLIEKNTSERFISPYDFQKISVMAGQLRRNFTEFKGVPATEVETKLSPSLKKIWEEVLSKDSELHHLLNKYRGHIDTSLRESTSSAFRELDEQTREERVSKQSRNRPNHETEQVLTRSDLESAKNWLMEIQKTLDEKEFSESEKNYLEKAGEILGKICTHLHKGREEALTFTQKEFWKEEILSKESRLKKLLGREEEMSSQDQNEEKSEQSKEETIPPELSKEATPSPENSLNNRIHEEAVKEHSSDDEETAKTIAELESVIPAIERNIRRISRSDQRFAEIEEDREAFDFILRYLTGDPKTIYPPKAIWKRWDAYKEGKGDTFELLAHFGMNETDESEIRNEQEEDVFFDPERDTKEINKIEKMIEDILTSTDLDTNEIAIFKDALYSLGNIKDTGRPTEEDITMWRELERRKGKLFELVMKYRNRSQKAPVTKSREEAEIKPETTELLHELKRKEREAKEKESVLDENEIKFLEKEIHQLMHEVKNPKTFGFLNKCLADLNNIKVSEADPRAYFPWQEYMKQGKLFAEVARLEREFDPSAVIEEPIAPPIEEKPQTPITSTAPTIETMPRIPEVQIESEIPEMTEHAAAPAPEDVHEIDTVPIEIESNATPVENPVPLTSAERTGKGKISPEDQKLIDEKLERFGISANEFRSIPGFKEIAHDAGRQIFVLDNLRQVWYKHTNDESEKRHETYVKEGGWGVFSKIKRNALKEKHLSKHKEDISREGFALSQFQEEAKDLIHIAAIGPELSVERIKGKEGTGSYRLNGEYLNVDFAKDNKVNEELVGKFNLAASRFVSFPPESEIKYLDKKQRSEYEKAKIEYEKQKAELLNALCGEKSLDPSAEADGSAAVNTIDFGVRMHQTFIHHPEVETELQKFSESKGWLGVGAKGFTIGALTRVGQAALRRGAKSAAMASIGAWSAPVVGAIISGTFGYFRGRKMGAKSLEKRDSDIREGKLRSERGLVDSRQKQATDKNFVSSEALQSKLLRLQDQLGKAQEMGDSDKVKTLTESLQSRIFYTRKKLLDETIAFGGQKEALNNKLNLIQAMCSAQVDAHISTQTKRGSRNLTPIEMLSRVIAKDSQEIEKNRKDYIARRGMTGALTGAGAAFIGYTAAEGIHEFAHDYLSHLSWVRSGVSAKSLGNNVANALKGQVSHDLTDEHLKGMSSFNLSDDARGWAHLNEQDYQFHPQSIPEVASAAHENIATTLPHSPENNIFEKGYTLTNERQSRESTLIKYLQEEKHMSRSDAWREANKLINNKSVNLGEVRTGAHHGLRSDRETWFKPVHKGDRVIVTEGDGKIEVKVIPKAEVAEYVQSHPENSIPSTQNTPVTPVGTQAASPEAATTAPAPEANNEENDIIVKSLRTNPSEYGYKGDPANSESVKLWASSVKDEIYHNDPGLHDEIARGNGALDLQRTSDGGWSWKMVDLDHHTDLTPLHEIHGSVPDLHEVQGQDMTKVPNYVMERPGGEPINHLKDMPPRIPQDYVRAPSSASTPSQFIPDHPADATNSTRTIETVVQHAHTTHSTEELRSFANSSNVSYETAEKLANFTTNSKTNISKSLESILLQDSHFNHLSAEQRSIVVYRLLTQNLVDQDKETYALMGLDKANPWDVPAGTHLDFTEILDKNSLKNAFNDLSHTSALETDHANNLHDNGPRIFEKLKTMDPSTINKGTIDSIIEDLKRTPGSIDVKPPLE